MGPDEESGVEWWIRDGSKFDPYLQVMGYETAPFRRCTPEEIEAAKREEKHG